MRPINLYIERLQRKGFGKCFCNLVTYLCDPSQRLSRKLYLKYKNQILAPLSPPHTHNTYTEQVPVWFCWLQGIENAPIIVQKCYASLQKYCANRPIHLITNENMNDFIILPNHVIQKYQVGIISNTHFSDILRLALLVKHGGIWIDSTVLLTDKLPANISDEPLFFFSPSVLKSDVPLPHAGSSWLLCGYKEHPLWQRQLKLLYDYWERENSLENYFLFHIFLYLLVTYNPQAKKYFIEMPHFCNSNPHLMQVYFNIPFSKNLWKNLLTESSIHKLTYKHKDPTPNEHTIWSYLINEYEV